MLCLYMRIVRTKHRFHSLFYMWERASTMFFTLQLWFVMLHTTKLKINKVLNKITRKLHNIRQVCYKKTDLCSWIFRDHWNFEFLYRLTRVKLYHHYEMVSFFVQKLAKISLETTLSRDRSKHAHLWADQSAISYKSSFWQK